MDEAERATTAVTDRERTGPILDVDVASELQQRWTSIQTGFVEDPQHALEEADGLVQEVIDRLRDTFAEERRSLEAEWSQHGGVSTEDMRLALQRYRSFFHRLLSTA